ncbi:MAG: hypothetical protein A3F12_01505 [Gammaproteobacteria bacterium RIFCSPHIGHO2_12_FULL_38_14]|nr:MAG: hypothetical protein A3F12_01505 [Gammaproteobacteria bacterium RIFCSPHIGHO2_12_FULL_38_14]
MSWKRITLSLFISAFCAGCSYNPFSSTHQETGSATATVAGAAIGAGSVGLLGGSKPAIAAAGIGGGAIGYYFTSMVYDAGNIRSAGGQVYQLGDEVGIVIPSDRLFEVNTAEFLPDAYPILDSVVAVLQRYPNNSVLISGNTSGFSRARYELALSTKRAERISAYLWNAGINQFKDRSIHLRTLRYVGYGNYFPIANNITNTGIRTNSRIQITSYPSYCTLRLGDEEVVMNNIGAIDQPELTGKNCNPCLTTGHGCT